MLILKKLGNVNIKANRHYSLVTICNYDRYNKPPKESEQTSGAPTDDLRPINGAPTDDLRTQTSTLNNLRELKRRVASPRAPFVPPSIEDVTAYCTERKNKLDAQQFLDHYTANGWKQGRGKPIVDWKAAVRTWEKNNFQSRGPARAANGRTREEVLEMILNPKDPT